MSGLLNDYKAAKKLVTESLAGNPDAYLFLSRAQRNLVLSALLKCYAQKIQARANDLSLQGKTALAMDGSTVSARLLADSDLIRFSVLSAIRDGWSSRGEEEIPEGRNILTSKKLAESPLRLNSNKDNILKNYSTLSRFFIPSRDSVDEKREKKLLFLAKNSVPLMSESIPKKIRMTLATESNPTESIFLCYFRQRVKQNEQKKA